MSNIHTQHTYRVDLDCCPLMTELERPLSHTDALADDFVIHVRRGMTPVNLTGTTVLGCITWEGRRTLPLRGEVQTGQTSAVMLTLPEEAYAFPGAFTLTIQAVQGDVRHTLIHLKGQMARTCADALISSETVLPTLPEFLEHLGAMDEAAAAALDAAATLTRRVDAALADCDAVVRAAGPAIICEATGPLAVCTNAAERPALSLITTLPPIAADAADSTTVTLTRMGRNLASHLDYSVTSGHLNTVITEDVIDVTQPYPYDYGKIPVFLRGGFTYTLVIDWEVYGRDENATGETTASYRIQHLNETGYQVHMKKNGAVRCVRTYTPAEDVDSFILWYPNFGSTVKACSRSRVMLLEGAYTADQAPAFTPCRKQTLTATLPGAVHGGTLNWTTGLLTITHGEGGAPLAETITHQLEPQPLTLHKGWNTLWSSTGDTLVTYAADTKLYIDERLAAIAASILGA